MLATSTRVILVAPSHPGNIGSVARAMKTMGFSSLYLVAPSRFPDPEAIALAAGADDILEAAVVVASLQEALIGCQMVVMTSARARTLDLPVVSPRALAAQVQAQTPAVKIALVFGRERAGLSNEELLQGHYHVMIPTNPAYTSLNLAQAVQLILYELSVTGERPVVEACKEVMASHEAIALFYEHLEEVLKAIGFLKTSAPRRLMARLRRLFGRIQLEKMEVDLLRGMLSRIQYQMQQRQIGVNPP